MKKLVTTGIALALGLGMTMTASAAGDAAKGKALFATCIACHGTDGAGNKALNAPAIAGQEEWYLERQLKNFKEGIRGADAKDVYGAQMRPMAMTLINDQAVADVAAYAASLPAKAAADTVTGDAAAGKASFAVCIACHGADAAGNKALNAPKLKGQHDWYIVRQIKNFKAGIRGANPKDIYGAQMRPMAMTVATDDIANNIAAYINSLK
ncbi:MAG: c-type cytochrome [SAR324 cluster bacterium]|nr:c-type cytochrome [SAR324 cluster bacterium]